MKKTVFLFIIASIILTASFTMKTGGDPQKPWVVTDAAKNKKNPISSNAASLAAGKTLWNTHCKSCHGSKGLGDESKSAQLKTEPGDFSKAIVQDQTDGALFFKISEGRKDMPSFKKKLPDEEDRWQLVNFMRTLKK